MYLFTCGGHKRLSVSRMIEHFDEIRGSKLDRCLLELSSLAVGFTAWLFDMAACWKRENFRRIEIFLNRKNNFPLSKNILFGRGNVLQ